MAGLRGWSPSSVLECPASLLHPYWLCKFCHSHPQPHTDLVIPELLPRTLHCSIPLTSHKACFPVLSLPSLLGPVLLARSAVLGPSLDQGSSLQLLSHLNFLTPFPFIHPPGAFHPSSLPFLFPPEGHKCCRRNAHKIALPSDPLCLAAHQLSSS